MAKPKGLISKSPNLDPSKMRYFKTVVVFGHEGSGSGEEVETHDAVASTMGNLFSDAAVDRWVALTNVSTLEEFNEYYDQEEAS